jgi:lysophospholipid acyltransferase (LPLAT)-like uncharacterized protein
MGPIRRAGRDFRPYLFSNILYHLSNLLGASLRVKSIGFPANPEKCIFCGWHGKSVIFASFFRRRGFWVIISQSKDGDIQATIFRRLGYNIIRGSTGREGVRAALDAIKVLKTGGTLAMTPDGPRGPYGEIQGGVMLMARKSGGKLIPVGVSARSRKIINSWDRHLVPYPFSKAVLIAGEPITVPANASDEEVEELRLKLKAAIDALEIEADRRMGRHLPATCPDQPKS